MNSLHILSELCLVSRASIFLFNSGVLNRVHAVDVSSDLMIGNLKDRELSAFLECLSSMMYLPEFVWRMLIESNEYHQGVFDASHDECPHLPPFTDHRCGLASDYCCIPLLSFAVMLIQFGGLQ